jgi:hypothetical protein
MKTLVGEAGGDTDVAVSTTSGKNPAETAVRCEARQD